MKRAGGLVATVYGDDFLTAESMLSHVRGSQLFKFQAIAHDRQYVQIINQGTQFALGMNSVDGSISLVPPDPTDQAQMWSVGATNQILWHDDAVVSLVGNGTVLELSKNLNSPDALQFEFLYPADFAYIRNCFTGRFLTSDVAGKVSWKMTSASLDDFQQWGVTSDGFLVCRGTAEVLQLSAATPSQGLALSTGPQVALGPGAAIQRFDVDNPDGTFHSEAGADYVIASTDSEQAVVLNYSAKDFKQLVEFISPFQFFLLENGGQIDGKHPWLVRGDKQAAVELSKTGDPNQLFTVSRYGELISRVDGFVLLSEGSDKVPRFVDPAPEAIGYEATTFVYNQLPSRFSDYASITLRNGGLGLIVVLGSSPVPWMYPLSSVAGDAAGWQLVGPPQSLFASYQELARQFFSNPAPLPGESTLDREFSAEVTELVGQLSKTTQVIIALITGILDIACGVSVGTVGNAAAEKIAKILLDNVDIAAKVAVIMGGSVTAGSIIAVADGITKSKGGLWWQILKLLLPNSFWGWAITVAKLSLTIASWAVGIGPAVTGAKIALLCTDIIRILKGAAELAAGEATLLAEHVARQLDALAT
jgi:hypothetical protein